MTHLNNLFRVCWIEYSDNWLSRSRVMVFRPYHLVVVFLVVAAICPFARTQALPGATAAPSASEGVNSAGYAIHQSIEAGYRFSDQTGSGDVYNTLINLQSGPRIFEQTLSMKSLSRESLLFDDLFVSSFGWGGDPNNVFRARVEKSKWYDFRGSFRRDQNFFDYNLLANPLNPSTSSPSIQAADSPHAFSTRRRMTDIDLTLRPQSALSFRLGFAHNNVGGPSFSSVHQGTDALLYQPWNTTLNSYRIGGDWKFLPRTVLSFDEFLDYYKGDTTWNLAPFSSALLPGNAKSVELGLPFNTKANQPCAVTGTNTTLINAGVLTNLSCNGYFAYSRDQRTRTATPTERISLRSSYFKRADLHLSYEYSSADLRTPNNEFFDGFLSRLAQRSFQQSGSSVAQRISNNADLGVILHISDRLRFVDTFRYDVFRSPGRWDLLTTAFYGANLASIPNVFSPATCPPPFTAATCPRHNASSAADVTSDFRSGSLKVDQRFNSLEGQYDFARHITARLGYRYERRRISDSTADLQLLTFYPTLPNRGACAGLPLSNGVCTTSALSADSEDIAIDSHWLIAGLTARPVHALRFVFGLEKAFSDGTVTRIGPRQESRYRVQVNYSPRPWATIGSSLNLVENSNNDLLTKARGHNRNVGFTGTLAPHGRFALDAAYNYSDYLQNALICFNDTPPTGVTLPVVAGAGSCSARDSGNPLLTDSYYVNNSHFGMATAMFKPVKRVTAQAGYSITHVDGRSPIFNILQPDGTLHYNYHQPLAQLSLELSPGLSWNAGWNYSQYGESAAAGPTAPRYFHANNATLSLHYSF